MRPSQSDCWFPRQEEKPRRRKIIAADLETRGLGGDFLLGATFDGRICRYFSSVEELLSWLLSRGNSGSLILFHNLEYDARYFLPYLRPLLADGFTITGRLRNEALLSLEFRRHRHVWIVADSSALMPAPLGDLSVFAGIGKLDIGLKDDVIFDPDNPEHREYLARDVEVLWRAYHGFADVLYDLFQINPRLTAGSTAVAAMSRFLPFPVWRQRPDVEHLARRSYFGGLTFLRTLEEVPNVAHLDANGMYGYALRLPLPIGSGSRTSRYWSNRPGIYEVEVEAPETIPFTFVPYRLEGGGVAWPYGRFQTVLTSPVIEEAESLGYRVRIKGGYIFEREDNVFGEFISRCEKLELAHKSDAVGMCIKFLRNNAYGKLAQRTEVQSLVFGEHPEATPIIDPYTGEIYEDIGIVFQHHESPFMQPHWASWVTTRSRLNLVHAIYHVNPDRVVFGDTDSLAVRLPAPYKPLLGRRYGQYKLERVYDAVRVIAPKVYIGVTGGTEVLKCKGIPLKEVDFERGESTFTALPKVRSMILYGRERAMLMTRSISDIRNSRSWYVDGTDVRPITIV